MEPVCPTVRRRLVEKGGIRLRFLKPIVVNAVIAALNDNLGLVSAEWNSVCDRGGRLEPGQPPHLRGAAGMPGLSEELSTLTYRCRTTRSWRCRTVLPLSRRNPSSSGVTFPVESGIRSRT